MVEKAHRHETSSRLLDRREFLRLAKILGAGAWGSTVGLEVLQREQDTSEKFSIDEDVLLTVAQERVKEFTQPPIFGIYPDTERPNAEPWKEVEYVRERIPQLQYVGYFVLLEHLLIPKKRTQLLNFLQYAQELSLRVVLSVGTGSQANWNKHPLHPDSYLQMCNFAYLLVEVLMQYPGTTVRLLFEGNIPRVHGDILVGPGEGLSGIAHAEGFRRVFHMFQSIALQEGDHTTQWAFNPSVLFPFRQLIADSSDAPEEEWRIPKKDEPIHRISPDIVGLDGYDLFAGKGKIAHPYYWLHDKTPEEVFVPAIFTLRGLIEEDVGITVWETASFTQNADWLRHAFLLILALGGQGLMHFNFDKRYTGKLHEAKWTVTEEIMEAYRWVLESVRPKN